VFGPSLASTVVFETSDLNICREVAVEIHPDAWEAIALSVSSVAVKNKDLASPRSGGERCRSLSQCTFIYALETQDGEDSRAPQHYHTRGKAPLTPKHAKKPASRLPNEVTQSENGLSSAATSYDNVRDSSPTDDLGDEELGSYGDDFDVTPAVQKGKGKSRARVESDGERDDDEGPAEGPSVARLPASYTLRNAKIEPSFSIVPSPPKRCTPAASPQNTVRGGAYRLFSPRVKSALIKPILPPTPFEEEKETKPLAHDATQGVSDASESPESQFLYPI
jgi:hypothetical protein